MTKKKSTVALLSKGTCSQAPKFRPATHMLKKIDSCKLSLDLHMHAVPQTFTEINK